MLLRQETNCLASDSSVVRSVEPIADWLPGSGDSHDLELPERHELSPLSLEDDDQVNARILFPARRHQSDSSASNTEPLPHLDAELNSLKSLILAQSTPGVRETAPQAPPHVLHPRMVEVISEILPGILSVWAEEDGKSRFIYNLSGSGDSKIVGTYTTGERQAKIRKYKAKLAKWRALHPLNRTFEGRRQIAYTKARRNGRFASATVEAG